MKFIFEDNMKFLIKILLFILILIFILLVGSDLRAQVKVSGLTETTSLNDSSLFAIQVDSSSYKVWRKFTGSSLKARALDYIYPILHFLPVGSEYQLQTTGIADNAVTLDKLDQTVIDFITGTSGTNPDTGNVRTTGDYMYGAYRHYGTWHEYGGVVGYSSSAYDLSLSDYFRLPHTAPALYGYTVGSLWYTTALNRGIFLRNNSGSNDTIPSLSLLRQIYGFATDTNKVTTTGDDYIYGNLCSYGWYKFSGGIRLPQITSPALSLEGEIWFNPNTQNFYGFYDEDRESYDYFIQNRHLFAFTGSANITTLGTITSGTWNGGTIPISYGGTGATNKTSALNNLLPTQTTRPYKFLRTDGYTSNWYDVYYTTYALNLSAAQYSIDLRSHQQSNLFVTCTPDQGGNTITEILGNKDGQTITLHNSFDASSDIIVNDGNNLILGDTSQDTLSAGESKTFRYRSSTAIWTELGVTPLEDKPDSLDEITIGESSLYSNNGFQGSLPYYDDYEKKLLIADEYEPVLGDVPVYNGAGWRYEPFYTDLSDSKSSYIDYAGYNETTNDSVVVFRARTNIYVDSIVVVVNDSSFTINYLYSSQRDSLSYTLARKMFTSDQVVTNKTTGSVFTTGINNRTIPKNNFICLAIRGKAGKTNENIFAEIYYREI